MVENNSLRVGCAGWSIEASYGEQFSADGTHLERYGSRFTGVEINSSFYRPHKPQTYAKWAASVPEGFQFAVKVPKQITHAQRLKECDEPLQRFLGETGHLGAKLGPLLVQLPPSLAFEEGLAEGFFALLRDHFAGYVVCEPRHLSWFAPAAEAVLAKFEVARVAADPALTPLAAVPGGWPGLVYYRLHGSPRVYYSPYSAEYLQSLTTALKESLKNSVPTWCIFDNTAEYAATGNALTILENFSLSNPPLDRLQRPETQIQAELEF